MTLQQQAPSFRQTSINSSKEAIQIQGSQGAAKSYHSNPQKQPINKFKNKRQSLGAWEQQQNKSSLLYQQSEGMYALEEGRGIDYRDKMAE